MTDIYTDGRYLAQTTTWHSEDSKWKAHNALEMLKEYGLTPAHVIDVGCGAGQVLLHIHNMLAKSNPAIVSTGYDVSADAIALAKPNSSRTLTYIHGEPFGHAQTRADLLLAFDVFEHVPNYLEFLDQCAHAAEFKMYHIPLDISVSTVFRRSFHSGRNTIGHLHYFSADSALATIQATHTEILGFRYTMGGTELLRAHFTFRRAAAALPRAALSLLSQELSSRLLGGASLLVIAR